MRKRAKSRRRIRARRPVEMHTRMAWLFGYYQTSARWREWVYRVVSLRQAQKMVADLKAVAIVKLVDGSYRTVGYRATEPIRRTSSSPTSLTRATMLIAAMQPAEIEASGLEREYERFLVWPQIGDTRAVCVRPRQTAAERDRALKLLGARPFER